MILDSAWLIILLCLTFSAFFSGIEIAYVAADKLQIEMIHQRGGPVGWVLGHFQKRRANFLSTTLVGNNLALVVYGIYMAALIDPLLFKYLPGFLNDPAIVLVLQSLISTLIVLVTAEFLPKSLFMLNPNYMLRFFALPMMVVYGILYVPVLLIAFISKWVIKGLLRQDYSEDKPVYGLTDLNNYIKSNLNVSKEDDHEIDAKIFNNALEFKEVKVRECMIPRTEIVAVDIQDDIIDLKKAFVESGHSKIVVYKDSIDEVIGYCHSLALFKKPDSIKKILTPIIIVPETMPANELLIQFINEHKSLALVVDEYGGTSGIVSIEDVIEEIFGEIRDEHDDEYLIEDKLPDGTYILSARHEIDHLNDRYSLQLPEGDYDTLGGLILNINENIPDIGDHIDHELFEFKILTMEENRIDRVQLIIKPEDD
ncbi:MAG: hemolysin family protein [Bacteroidota bacterium]